MSPSLNLPTTLISSCEQSPAPAKLLVLDTNAVLDWLLFSDPAMRPLAAAVEQGRLRWIATAAMRAEFAHVLGRGLAASRGADPGRLELAWRHHCTEQPTAPLADARLHCTDTDDQKFLDLALASGALWLVSRDRAVLKLGRRAAVYGLAITTPDRWRPE